MVSRSSRHALLQSCVLFVTIALLSERLLPGYKARSYVFQHQKHDQYLRNSPQVQRRDDRRGKPPWWLQKKRWKSHHKKDPTFDQVVATFQEARKAKKIWTDSVERIESEALTLADLLAVLAERRKIDEVEAILGILSDLKALLEEEGEYDAVLEEMEAREDNSGQRRDRDEQWEYDDAFREPSAGIRNDIFDHDDEQREQQPPPSEPIDVTPLDKGSIVLARDAAHSYLAEVESTSLPEGTCIVKFLDNNVSTDVKLSDVRKVDPLRDCVYAGALVKALYGEDDAYRPAEVVKVEGDFLSASAVVRFNTSKGREDMPVNILRDLQFTFECLEVGSILQVEYDGPTDLYWGQVAKVNHQKKTADVLYLESNTYEPDVAFQRLRYQ